jgi:hypothetical protein
LFLHAWQDQAYCFFLNIKEWWAEKTQDQESYSVSEPFLLPILQLRVLRPGDNQKVVQSTP